jgi:hypothetical protein
MSRAILVAGVLRVAASLRRSQAKTLAELAAAAATARAGLANLGRNMAGPARCKHTIKRAAHFVANRRVSVAGGMAGVIDRLTRRRHSPLAVRLDRAEVRDFHAPVAAAAAGGRSIPLLGASYPEWELHKGQNDLEEGLIRLLRSLVSDRVRIVLLAGRGFGRAELARTLSGLVNVSIVVRIKPQALARHPRFTGQLIGYPVRKGMRRVLRGARFRSTDPVDVNVVIRWKKGRPAGRDGPRFLITDLGKHTAIQPTELYGRRMGIEEFFRDSKGPRNGLALRHTELTRADRFDRLLLILALAYLLLAGLGLRALGECRPGEWSSRNKGNTCSAAMVGRALWRRFPWSPAAAIAAILAATIAAAQKWG